MKADIREDVEIPQGVTAKYENRVFTAQGQKGTVEKRLFRPKVDIRVENGTVVFEAKQATQREKRYLYTLKAHAQNMMRGANQGHTYKLKICSGHFPMNVAVSGEKLTVKNFLGEAVPRVLKLKQGAEVKIDGDEIVVTSTNIELAGQQAADIEQLTRITNRDRRIFQDGLYIIEKDGEALQ